MTDPRSAELTVVSGASSNHAVPLTNLLRSLALCEVRARTIVYDLGLAEEEGRAIRAQCDDFRTFAFDRYPPFVDIRVRQGEYAWKPIIVDEVVTEVAGPVLWLDAGDVVYGDLERVKRILREQGFYSPFGGKRDIRRWAHPGTLRYLGAEPGLLTMRTRDGAIVGFDPRRPGIPEFVRRWRNCALERECIAPVGSDRSNHRQDMAVLSVLAYQFQETYGFELVDEKIEIATHYDQLGPTGLEAAIEQLRRSPDTRLPGPSLVRRVVRRSRKAIRRWLRRLPTVTF